MKRLITCGLFTLSCFFGFAQPEYLPQPATYVCPPCGGTCDSMTYDKRGVCEHCNMILIEKNQMKTIAFYLQDGVEILDFGGPMEVFVYAGYQVFTVSKTKDPIQAQGILNVTPDYSIEDAPEADILAFFGGNSANAYQDRDVIEWTQKQKGVEFYFSVCTGAFVLAEAGILDGKVATTFHDALDQLEADYPKIDVRKNVRFVDNGKIITTAGVSAGIDGALHLVAKLQGINAAMRTAYYMEYDNWQTGNGLILSENSPYSNLIQSSELKPYTGRYEYKDGSEIVLKMDEKSGLLYALVADREFPLYYESRDFFSDVANEPILFQRNEQAEIVSYKLSSDGKFYQKLD